LSIYRSNSESLVIFMIPTNLNFFFVNNVLNYFYITMSKIYNDMYAVWIDGIERISGMKQNGMEWNRVEWYKYFIPLVGYFIV
jgi:hypothetical protein